MGRTYNKTRKIVGSLGLALALVLLLSWQPALAAGILTAKDSCHTPIQIRDHQVNVTINNGFAMTEVIQTFYNPNAEDLEAVYSCPLPQSASLSEVTLIIGENEIHGEVLTKEQARRIYREERDKGNETGLAEKNEFYTFDFSVSPVRAQAETHIRYLYYQPLTIEMGVGRYLYPLEEGGTDELAMDFWTSNTKVERFFSVNLELKSAWPVTQVRCPGFESEARIEQSGEGNFKVLLERQNANLNKDFVFYYRLAEDLPGRVELIPYRSGENSTGSFMLVVTPGMDLKPLDRGADYTFVLDVSGSMDAKIATLARGVVKALGQLKPHDRFRIITFNNSAGDLTGGFVAANVENVHHYISLVESLRTGGGTNLYAGLDLALDRLDDDRATSIVLVTDGVTNQGIVDPKEFYLLLKRCDVRVFGFLMGNSANWPLMRLISESSGGFSASVSNDDDIVGQIMLAKSKIVYECMHDAELSLHGAGATVTMQGHMGKVYRGQQFVLFGRYTKAGPVDLMLTGRMTGEDKTYSCRFDLPEIDTDHPELERLYALNRIEALEYQTDIGNLEPGELKTAVRDLGLQYQLVTDETSMVILADKGFEERGIERKNRDRVAREELARAERAGKAGESGRQSKPRRVDQHKPMFDEPSPSVGRGMGAVDPGVAGMGLALLLIAGSVYNRSSRKRTGE